MAMMELDRASLDSGLIPQATLPCIGPKILWLPHLYIQQMEGEGKEQAKLRIKQSFSKGPGLV